MTSIEALVAQPPPTADPARASDVIPSPAAALAAGDAPPINSPAEYHAAKAALASDGTAQNVPDDLEEQIRRDEFGDAVPHDEEDDLDAGPAAAPEVPVEEPTSQTPAEPAPATPASQPERPPQFRLRPTNPVDQLALEFQKRNPDWTLKEALAAAEAASPAATGDPTPAAQPETPQLDPNLPQTVEDLKKLRKEKSKALRETRLEISNAELELRHEDKPELIERLNALELELEALDDHEPRLQSHLESYHAKYEADYSAAAARATELYPDVVVPESAFARRMAEIDASFLETGDPRFQAPDKPMLIAQMVAAELQVAPRSRAAVGKPTASAPQPPVVATNGASPSSHMPPPVASGLARTTAPAVSTAEAAIAAVRTPDQLDKLKLQLLGRNAAV